LAVRNPASEDVIGSVPVATADDLDEALAAAERGFATWRRVSAHDRAKVMRKAADLLRERSADVGRRMTLEQGKPRAQAIGETRGGADTIDWTKVRNAGQVCVSPTRLLVQAAAFDEFVDVFTTTAKAIRVGDGLDDATEMGPLANERRIPALESLLADARDKGGVKDSGHGSEGGSEAIEPYLVTKLVSHWTGAIPG
jgi:acyl-CoA reductase-like NAD-dependent aldehyde dehydrogenase